MSYKESIYEWADRYKLDLSIRYVGGGCGGKGKPKFYMNTQPPTRGGEICSHTVYGNSLDELSDNMVELLRRSYPPKAKLGFNVGTHLYPYEQVCRRPREGGGA